MMFWIAAAILTGAVTAAIAWPLFRRSAVAVNPAVHDAVVYRDQLTELDRDVENGGLTREAADTARAEIARRLLKAADEERRPARPDVALTAQWPRLLAAVLVVVVVPVVGLGSYLMLGSPGLSGEPLSAREAGPNGNPQLAQLIERAEDHLRAHPEDGRGWDVLAPIYLRAGRIEDARVAYGDAIRLLGPTARRESGFGEAMVMSNGGTVDDQAKQAFEQALKLDPDDPKSAFFLALGLAQQGKNDKALAAFQDLAKRTPANAPWLAAVEAQIAALGGDAEAATAPARPSGQEGGSAAPGNPTDQQMAAAAQMSASDRAAMIRGMVKRLDASLASNPRNFEGWQRLLRSYMVLGEPDRAKAALSRALKVYPAGSDNAKALTAMAGRLGVTATEAEQ